MTNLQEIWNDAGLLREFIAKKYEHQFVVGFSVNSFGFVMDVCKRIARLTGDNADHVFDVIQADVAGY